MKEDDPFFPPDELVGQVVVELRPHALHLVAIIVGARLAVAVALGLPVPLRAVAPRDPAIPLIKLPVVGSQVVEVNRCVAALQVQGAVARVPERTVVPGVDGVASAGSAL